MEQLTNKRLNFEKTYQTPVSALNHYRNLKNRKSDRLAKLFEAEGIDFENEILQLRDGMIHRFEYTLEVFWKYLKVCLEQQGTVPIQSGPKNIVREAVKVCLISEEEGMAMMNMIDKRNLTSHVYRLEVAQQLEAEMPGFVELLGKTISRT